MLLPSPACGSDLHTHAFDLKPGWLLHLSLEQHGVDVVARVFGPDGRELFRVDSPTGGKGSEEVWLVARSAGVHCVVAQPWPGTRGRYEVRLRALRPATAADRANATAERDYLLAYQREKVAPLPWLEGVYLRASKAWESLGKPEREADARFRLGQVRASQGNWQGALEAQRRARGLFHLAGARREEVLSLDRMADAYLGLGRMEEARRTLQEMLLKWGVLREPRNVVATSYRLCQLAHLAGRPWEALQCYERVLQGWRKLGNREAEGKVLVDVGALYISLGDVDQALDSLRKALALLPAGSDDRRAALSQIGAAYLRAGFPWQALVRFRQALAAGAGASALSGMALAWQGVGEPGRALPLFRRALALLHKPADKAAVWCHIGRLHLSLGQPRSAAAAFELALSLGGGLLAQAEAFSGLARAARLQGDLPAAAERMEQALDRVESLRARFGPPVPGQRFREELLAATWLASRQEDYAFLVDLLMERHRLEPDRGHDLLALEVNDRALARSLADSIGTGRGTGTVPWPSLLDADTVLVEYSLGEKRSYLWWVTRSGHGSFQLPDRAAIETAVRQLYDLVSRSRSRPAAIQRQSARVAGLLLGPLAGLRQRRLAIAAPDILQYVPFEALLIGRHEVVRIPSATVLARLRARSATRERSRGLGLLADGVFSTLDGRLPSRSRTPGEGGPKRLPFVKQEVRSVLRRAGDGEVLAATGFDAVPEVALGGALKSLQFLHVAGHGRADEKRPGRSGILLSSLDPRGRPRPGWLTAEKVREIDLQARVAVLSGCRTALGREVRGEGLVGLSHSVLAAGASSVVASLWNVDDQATAALMDRFYRELMERGRSPAEALRLAQLSLRSERRWQAPYYWGGFVLQGDWLNNARSGGSP